jgi:hypothetical protein
MGFDINGEIIYCHEFNHANIQGAAYIRTANLPIKASGTSQGGSGGMSFICASVISEGGQDETYGYQFHTTAGVTAGASDTHVLTLRPKTTFNGITNRTVIELLEVSIIDTGGSPIHYTVCIGQQISGGSTADVNTAFSTMEVVTGATLVGTPALVIDGGFVPDGSFGGTQGATKKASARIPITLDAAGNQRDNGTITVLVDSLGGASGCEVGVTWKEIR